MQSREEPAKAPCVVSKWSGMGVLTALKAVCSQYAEALQQWRHVARAGPRWSDCFDPDTGTPRPPPEIPCKGSWSGPQNLTSSTSVDSSSILERGARLSLRSGRRGQVDRSRGAEIVGRLLARALELPRTLLGQLGGGTLTAESVRSVDRKGRKTLTVPGDLDVWTTRV